MAAGTMLLTMMLMSVLKIMAAKVKQYDDDRKHVDEDEESNL